MDNSANSDQPQNNTALWVVCACIGAVFLFASYINYFGGYRHSVPSEATATAPANPVR